MKFDFSQQIFEKVLNIKFNQNPSTGSQVPCEQMDMTKPIVAFHNVADTLKMGFRSKQTLVQDQVNASN
jgi:hypothetical protein